MRQCKQQGNTYQSTTAQTNTSHRTNQPTEAATVLKERDTLTDSIDKLIESPEMSKCQIAADVHQA